MKQEEIFSTFKAFFLCEENRIPIKTIFSPWGKSAGNMISIFEAENFLRALEGINYQIDTSEISVTEKIDGTSVKFGIDPEGRFFLQSSYSGPVYQASEFNSKIKQHLPTRRMFVNSFESIKEWIEASLSPLMKEYGFEKRGIKVQCEWLYVPNAVEVTDKTIRFVAIRYDRSHFESITHKFFIIKITDFSEKINYDKYKDIILSSLKRNLPEGFDIQKTRLQKQKGETNSVIDLQKEAYELKKFLQAIKKQYPNLKEILSARSKNLSDIKKQIQQTFMDIMKKFHYKFAQTLNRGLMGEYEGFVIDLPGFKFKVINPIFWQNKGKTINI